MDFRILGSVEVLDQGRVVALGGRRQRALLALLLVHLNEALSFDRLIEELWGDQRPAGADRTLHVHVSRLRKALVPTGGHGADGDGMVVTRGRSYVLMLDPERLDTHRFERLIADGGRELATGRPEAASATFERALALWRGAPLGDVGYEPFAQAEIRRLEELRGTAVEQHIESELALGRHADVVGRVPAAIREYPHREQLRSQLMLALYRCDRQADALQAYQDARHDLVEELGIEPGERLRDLHRAILLQDPVLALPGDTAGPRADNGRATPAPAGARRLVTLVVANVAGTSAFAEAPDLEHLHGVLAGRAALCADVLERHGGTVEKFDGDTVVGTFGLDALHEDDALRAVRAALEVRAVGAGTLAVNTGEVYVGTGTRGETFATGDVRRVATRLGDAADDGEIVLGELTHRLVAAHVVAEPLGPLPVRGRREGVHAFKLLDLRPGEAGWPGPPATPMIDREEERDQLRQLLRSAERADECRVATVIGPPGIGKSRLAREFIEEVSNDARVVVGRCLSYGDGITYRPLAEIVGQLSGGDPERGIAALVDGVDEAASISRHVLGAIGLADEPAQTDETFWAVRRLLETAAHARPLVVVIEDAHWAEPTLLDLLDYLVAFSGGAPLMLLCLARPELLENRPTWAAPQRERSLLELDALTDAEAQTLVQRLATGELGSHSTGRIVKTAEGNPLFLEQLVAVRAEHGLTVLPPSIEAVLAARIERLEPDERAVLLHASVEGRSFHRGAVAALLAKEGRDAISAPLMGLLRKKLIRPDRPEFAGEDAFRFSHALIREAAYGGMPKRVRADLHEQLADWLKAKPRVADEILGYHLEQAVGLRAEIGVAGDRERALAREGADRLAAAARSALARGVAGAGARLLERAAALLDADDPGCPELVCALVAALIDAGRLTDAGDRIAEAIERAVLDGDAQFGARARVDQQLVRLHAGTSGGHEQARQIADEALAHLERHGDSLGQCRAWRLRAWIDWIEGRLARADEAWQRAAIHARRAGDERELFDILGWRSSAAVLGPTPVADAIVRCEHIREHVGNSDVAVALTLHPLGLLYAMTGDFDQARRLIVEGNEILGKLGRMQSAVSHHEALVELMAGRPDQAEAKLRPGYEQLERMGERELLSTTAALLAQAVYAQERFQEADELCRLSERIAAPEDVVTQIMWRGMRARLLARRGEAAPAERLVGEAVLLADATDLLVLRGDAQLDVEEVACKAGRQADARAAVERALELYEQKGDRPSAARARSRLQAEPAPAR